MTSSTDRQEPLPESSTVLELGRIIGKKVKTVDHQDLGKVVTTLESEQAIAIIISPEPEAVSSNYNYRIPENLVQGFDGPDLMLSIPRTELGEYEIQDIHSYAAKLKNVEAERKMGEEQQEIIVPIIEEKLHVSKKIITDEVTIIKEPVTETKIIGVSVMHEELVLEKRPPTLAAEDNNNKTVSEKPPPKNTRTQIRIPLIYEEIRIKKEPYVKEEVVISKKPRTETKTVSALVINEKVDTSENTVTQSF